MATRWCYSTPRTAVDGGRWATSAPTLCRSMKRCSASATIHTSTRVMSFSREKGSDGLWWQRIDLIGDKRRCQVGEGIEDGAMLGQPEGGEFLDVADNGFDDVAPVEQSLVEERHWQALHVAPHPGHQDETAAEQSLCEALADIAFVAEQLADQVLGQLRRRRGVSDVAGRQCQRDDLAFLIEHQMQLQAEEPARAGLATLGQAGKHLVALDATRVTHRQGRAVDVIDPCPSSHPGEQI